MRDHMVRRHFGSFFVVPSGIEDGELCVLVGRVIRSFVGKSNELLINLYDVEHDDGELFRQGSKVIRLPTEFACDELEVHTQGLVCRR